MLSLAIGAALVAIVLPFYLYKAFFAGPDLSHLPIINPYDGPWFWRSRKNIDKWSADADGLVQEGLEKFGGKPFRIATNQGEKILLSPAFVDAVKSDPRLSFDESVKKTMLAHMWGFEAFRASTGSSIVKDMVRIKLTQNLTKVTRDLATEVSTVLEKRWGNSTEWHDVDLANDVLKLVARLSTRVFMGPELANNEEWLDIAINYTVWTFTASRDLRNTPAAFRSIANVFLPSSRALRASSKRAKEIVEPIVAARRKARLNPDFKPPNDSLEWFDDIAKSQDYDPTLLQLALTMAAIHTTADLTKASLFEYAANPEFVPELRRELVGVLSDGGWDKMSLYKLQLLDSSIKEAQRIKPISGTSMGRLVMADVVLPDGTLLPKNSEIMVSSHSMWDPKIHKDADKYDARRFMNIRNTPGRENAGQLVTTSGDHLAFGHGKHACPGRFFAANEVKISMAYAVINYDIRLPENKKPTHIKMGFEYIADPFTTIQVRKRTPEIDLDALN